MAEQELDLISAPENEANDPILDAAHDEFSIAGIQRTNMDAVAKHAGVSRATLYRRFPTKFSLLEAVGQRASRWAGKRVSRMTAGQSPQEAVVTAFLEYSRVLRSVPFFREMLDYTLSRHNGGERLLGDLFTKEKFVADFIEYIVETLRNAGATMPDDELRTVAEIQLRLAMSIVISPSRSLDITDDKSLTKFVRSYLSPMVY